MGLACTGYRLPIESEWETASRAGTTTSFYNGEMTATTGTNRVVRGGSWNNTPPFARAASRVTVGPAAPSSQTGFRLARTVP